jgi:hypothetical protein
LSILRVSTAVSKPIPEYLSRYSSKEPIAYGGS